MPPRPINSEFRLVIRLARIRWKHNVCVGAGYSVLEFEEDRGNFWYSHAGFDGMISIVETDAQDLPWTHYRSEQVNFGQRHPFGGRIFSVDPGSFKRALVAQLLKAACNFYPRYLSRECSRNTRRPYIWTGMERPQNIPGKLTTGRERP